MKETKSQMTEILDNLPKHIRKNLTPSHISKDLEVTPKERSRGNKRAKIDILRIKSDIFTLSDNHTDHEIMEILRIPNQTYYRLKGELYQEAKEIWQQTYKESIESRILHVINSLNLALKISKEIATDTNNSAKDRLDASEKMIENELGFLKLLREVHDDYNISHDDEMSKTQQPLTTPHPYVDPPWIEANKKRVKKLSQELELLTKTESESKKNAERANKLRQQLGLRPVNNSSGSLNSALLNLSYRIEL
ncbi:MAG TPA: hypothetical protein VF884_15035 [Nitrososphaeraceae archaeon]